jgi:hypothetical protein
VRRSQVSFGSEMRPGTWQKEHHGMGFDTDFKKLTLTMCGEFMRGRQDVKCGVGEVQGK